ncbi:hypothetical protein BRPE64_ACDS21580 [Caballeronia insecticola]|uniref:Uncharacterized protein n=1 Tax=Caballeronia insecticola TaxID=758793 RepID=R4WZL5_9BURK|nr:hypothetical protein BRPE64_ACDS21580 [Caballeronia insecticola]
MCCLSRHRASDPLSKTPYPRSIPACAIRTISTVPLPRIRIARLSHACRAISCRFTC